MELKQVAANTHVIEGPTNLGVYVEGNDAFLIDSGNDESAGRKVLKLLDGRGWKLKSILNTHSNADHIGGNAFLQKRTGCRIAATRNEAPMIADPSLEPLFLWGAAPFKDLRGKFLQAEPSEVTDILPPEGPVEGTPFSTISLPGHYIEMVGFRTPDDVVFLADSLFSETILAKYGFVVCCDVAGQFATLDRLESLDAKVFVPCHAGVSTDIRPLVTANRDALRKLLENVSEACATGASREDVLARLVMTYGINLSSVQYVLTSITVSACLSFLADQGKIVPSFEKGRMLWHLRP
jgi:glyoxylase-like metal-dependent hydrolase (beta-lactamase superfamily II)